MYRQLPNSLTVLRLLLAAVFFIVLNQYRYEGHHGDPQTGILFFSMGLFILASLTDALDGYLARKWKVESTFGRIMDPFCDKVLVIGAFIYLSGPRFVIPEKAFQHEFFNMISGVYPWMVALMLARELLVTGIRGELEGSGVQFPAKVSGKLKMILQSVGVPAILLIVWLNPRQEDAAWLVALHDRVASHIAWPLAGYLCTLAGLRDILVYAIVLSTIISGIPYVQSAIAVLRKSQDQSR